MKKLLITFLSVLILTTTQAGTVRIIDNTPKELPQHFRDVKAATKLNIAIDSAISRGILAEGSFFRPNEDVPAVMFWEMVLRDNGFEPENNNFQSFLNEAVNEDLISPEEAENIDEFQPITKFQAIKTLIKLKNILPPRRISQKFRGIYPLLDDTEFEKLPYIETAQAAGLFSVGELKFFNPAENLTRRELVMWIYNYFDHGTRNSKMEADTAFRRNIGAFRDHGLSSRFAIQKKNSREKEGEKNLSIRVLKSGEIERLSQIKNSFPGKDVLDEIYNEIITHYRFIDDLTDEKKQEMIDKALSSLVQVLGDKYSNYIKPSKSTEYKNQLDGKFEGIGAYVEIIDTQFTIVAPISGSPAEKAGIEPRDIVLKVDNIDVGELPIRETVNLIMGPAGTTVELKISRNSQIHNFTVVRDRIIEPAVILKWKKSVPIIEIHQFNHDTIGILDEIVDEVLSKNVRGIVLDLRNNPGGYLDSAVDVGSLFLEKGKTIFYTEDREKTAPFVAKKDGLLRDIEDIVVIENGGTASASEILIGMLQDYKNVKIIGQKSLGKGTVQTVRDLKNGGVLKLTVAKWLTPNKRWINESGIIPDLEIANPTQAERTNEIDHQLDAAVREVLN